MSNPLVKVVHKSKTGATVHSFDGAVKQIIPWIEFDKYFKYAGKENIYEMILDDETDKMVDEVVKRFKWLARYMPVVLILMNKKQNNIDPTLEELSQFGNIINLYCEEFGLPVASFLEDVQAIRNNLLSQFGEVK